MKMKKVQLPYIPKIWASILYLGLFVVVFLLFWGRKSEAVQWYFLLEICPDFYSHISNFAISFMLMLVGGYMGVLRTGRLKSSVWIFIFLIFANLIYEFFIPFLNTPDPIDAWFGIVGTFFAMIYLVCFQKWGILPNPILK